MAIVTILSAALRGNTSATFPITAGAPRHVRVTMVSPTYPTDPSLTFAFTASRSPDGVQPFVSWFGSGGGTGGGAGVPGKFGVPQDGLWAQICSWEGEACVVRVDIVVGTPFVWGLTAELI